MGLARKIEDLLMEPVPVTEKGMSGKASAFELIVRQLLGKVSDGKRGAYRALCRYQAYARARPRPRLAGLSNEEAENAYARSLQVKEDDFQPQRRKTSADKRRTAIDERIQRMRAGLEAIEIPEGANAKQAMEIYEISLRQPVTRSAIRTARSRKNLSPDEIFDLALYSKLVGKFGGRAAPTRIVVAVRRLIMKAVGGEVQAAVLILDLHDQGEKQGDL
jgi:hypothetical protein